MSDLPAETSPEKPKRLRYADRVVGTSMGRPSLYRPEYCEMAEGLGRQGYSQAQIATEMGVDKGTMLGWAGVHPDFATSLARAKTFEQAEWERTGKKALNRKHFQSQVWRTSMAARFKDDYTERTEIHGQLDLAAIISSVVEAKPGDSAKQVQAQDVVLEGPDRDKPNYGK